MLKLDLGDWCSDTRILKEEAVKYFSNLYSHEDENIRPWQLTGYFPHLSMDKCEALAKNIDN